MAARFITRADPCRLSGPLKIVGSCTHTVTNEEKMGRYNFDSLQEYFQQCNHRDYPLFKAVISIMAAEECRY
jgi:hypothetical protein